MVAPRRPLALHLLESEPARIPFSLRTFLKRDRTFRMDLCYRLVVVGAGLALESFPLLIAGLLILIPPALRLRRIANLMQSGSFHPAKVVSLHPPLIAYYGDLSKGAVEAQPVVVIQKMPLIDPETPLDSGDRVAVVARPIGGDSRRFDKLEARLVASVNGDASQLARAISSVAEWQWDDLDDALFELPHPYEIGVHSASIPERIGAH